MGWFLKENDASLQMIAEESNERCEYNRMIGKPNNNERDYKIHLHYKMEEE